MKKIKLILPAVAGTIASIAMPIAITSCSCSSAIKLGFEKANGKLTEAAEFAFDNYCASACKPKTTGGVYQKVKLEKGKTYNLETSSIQIPSDAAGLVALLLVNDITKQDCVDFSDKETIVVKEVKHDGKDWIGHCKAGKVESLENVNGYLLNDGNQHVGLKSGSLSITFEIKKDLEVLVISPFIS